MTSIIVGPPAVSSGYSSNDCLWPLGIENATSNRTISATDRVYAFGFYTGRPISVDNVKVNLVTAEASAACRIGLYNNNYTTGRPSSLIVDCGELDLSATTGDRTLTFAASTIRGVVWVLIFHNSPGGALVLLGPATSDIHGWMMPVTGDLAGGSRPWLRLDYAYPLSAPDPAPAVETDSTSATALPTLQVA